MKPSTFMGGEKKKNLRISKHSAHLQKPLILETVCTDVHCMGYNNAIITSVKQDFLVLFFLLLKQRQWVFTSLTK